MQRLFDDRTYRKNDVLSGLLVGSFKFMAKLENNRLKNSNKSSSRYYHRVEIFDLTDKKQSLDQLETIKLG